MGIKRSEFSADEWGERMVNAYDTYAENHKAGLLPEGSPKAHEIYNMFTSANRAARNAAASGELEKSDRSEPTGDDPGEFAGKPPNPQRKGGELQQTQDSAPRLPHVGADGRIHHAVTVDEDRIVSVRRR